MGSRAQTRDNPRESSLTKRIVSALSNRKMKRKDIEAYIDTWMAQIETIGDLKVLDGAISSRFNQIRNLSKTGAIDKKQYSSEYKCLKFLRKRVELIQTAMLQASLEQQAYLILPEHEKCGIQKYRYLASFQILPSNIRSIKGFELLEQLGWYHPQTNPGGVVKDHRLSVKFGFDNNIDPNIIGHLANCEFLRCADNTRKSSNSSVTLNELKIKIKSFKGCKH